MTKRIVSGIFILTALGALGVILAGALTSGEQLIVRFLTAVIVAALGLYVISDLRLQADDDAMTARTTGHPRMATVDAPPNSTAAFMATVTKRSEKAGEINADSADPAHRGANQESLAVVEDAGSSETGIADSFGSTRSSAPETIRADVINPPPEVSLADLFSAAGNGAGLDRVSPTDEIDEEPAGDTEDQDDPTAAFTSITGRRLNGLLTNDDTSDPDRSVDEADQTSAFELPLGDETAPLERVELAAAGVHGSSLNGSYLNGAQRSGSWNNGSDRDQSNGSDANGGNPGVGDSNGGHSTAGGSTSGGWSTDGSFGSGSRKHGAHDIGSTMNGSPANGSAANGAAQNGAAVNGEFTNGASLRSIGPIEGHTDTARPVQTFGDDDRADGPPWPEPVVYTGNGEAAIDDGADGIDDLSDGADLAVEVLVGHDDKAGQGRVLEGDDRDGETVAEPISISGFGYSDELQSRQQDWPAPPPKNTDKVPQPHPFERASAAYQAEKDRLAVAKSGNNLPVVLNRQGLRAADYADAPLAPIIDLRGELSNQHSSGVDAAINAGEVEVIATLIEQGMLSTAGAISDRDVRTMVYVAFTSNELRKLLLAGGTPDGPNYGLDLGPVELFDERVHAPAPKTLYAGAPRRQAPTQTEVQSQIG